MRALAFDGNAGAMSYKICQQIINVVNPKINRNESLKDTIEIAFTVQNNTVALMKIISNRVKFPELPDEDIEITS